MRLLMIYPPATKFPGRIHSEKPNLEVQMHLEGTQDRTVPTAGTSVSRADAEG